MITPVRLTDGPRYHWFGYYDKQEVDPSGRYVLAMAVDFEHRSPLVDDELSLGMIDLQNGNEWVELGTTRSWGWQQGCMLQWLPGHDSICFWNDREDDRFVCRLMDAANHSERTLPTPVYTVSPDGSTALTPDFRRINDTRPGYGYAGLPDPYADHPTPEKSGICRVDMATGESEQIISIADVAAIHSPNYNPGDTKHWFNHLLFNADGSRFIFLHRWRAEKGFATRMLTADVNGNDIRVLDDFGGMSHFIWRDPQTILAWSWQPSHKAAFYLYNETTGDVKPVGLGVMEHNGHCTYLPDQDWILNDTYPQGQTREQELYLYHLPTERRVDLGRFHSPPEYTGEWRCDLHPRADRDGKTIYIDSVHEGLGRQVYRLDIAEALAL